MRTVDLFPAEVHLHDGRILTACRLRVDDGIARVWRWVNNAVVQEYEGRVTLFDLHDETPYLRYMARGRVSATHHLAADVVATSDVAFTAVSGGCECGGAWNLRFKIEGAPRL